MCTVGLCVKPGGGNSSQRLHRVAHKNNVCACVRNMLFCQNIVSERATDSVQVCSAFLNLEVASRLPLLMLLFTRQVLQLPNEERHSEFENLLVLGAHGNLVSEYKMVV